MDVTALEQQYRSWEQRIKAPYDKQQADAYTRTVETTIAYEQVAVDLTASFARNEPDWSAPGP